MKLLNRSVELIVIRNIFNPQEGMQYFKGHCIESLLKQAFDKGLSENVRILYGNLTNDVTPRKENKADVDRLMCLDGRFYAVVQPMAPLAPWVVSLIISVTVAVATAFLMPVPTLDSSSQNQPPSPNNALAARTNKQRLGGRIPDIFGTVWSVPDLIAVTYSVYINNREVEFSYMCVGRGRYNVTDAMDDATPINQVFGSSVMIFDPDKSLSDEPSFLFGSAFSAEEAELSRMTVKRYTSVNGQLLQPTNNYLTLDKAVFRAGGIIEQSGFNFVSQFKVGDAITVVQTNPAESANGITDPVDQGDPPANPPIVGPVTTYSLSGAYTIAALTEDRITLSNPASINPDWQKLADNADYTVETEATVSTQSDSLWQGWFYTNDKDHEKAFINIVARGGLYISGKGNYQPIGLRVEIESEVVDSANNPVPGTLETVTETIYGSGYEKYASGGGVGYFRDGNHWWSNVETPNEDAAESAAATFDIKNSNMGVGKRLRFRIRRKDTRIEFKDTYIAYQELRVADFYGARLMTTADMPKGVTTVYSKTLATEGALSLKERKLRLLVQRYVTDATTGILKLSNRADDIIRHIATDPKIGNLDLSQTDIAQIKTEVDNIIAYFGTPLCAEFCGTFDDTNLSAEETIQTVARAVFSQAKRQGNKIMLDFERKVPASVAVFNSHNILPDTYSAPQSFGVPSNFDGVKVEYTDPVDDATVTLNYPNESIVNPHPEKLIGVRNKIQAHMHAMRILNRDLFVYKSCEFTAGDESNIVVRTNRITVADQLRANVQQGTVSSIETIGSDIVLHTDYPINIEAGTPQTMFIQTINNGVEAIEVTARDDYSMTLARLPSGEISTGPDSVVQAVFVTNTDIDRDAYLITEKSPSEGMTNKLTCTNYDDRYYQNDTDYTNGLIA